MAIPKRTRKKTVRARARSGLAAAPIDKGFDAVKYYFHLDIMVSVMKTYIKNHFKKNDQKAILSNPDYKFWNMTHYAATAFWVNTNQPETDQTKKYSNALQKYLEDLIEPGKDLLRVKGKE